MSDSREARAVIEQLIQEMRDGIETLNASKLDGLKFIAAALETWADRLALLADVLRSPVPEQDQEGEVARVDEHTVIPPERATAASHETTPAHEGLTLRQLQRINTTRAARWHPGGLADWSPLEWAGAMAGEAGEACNAAKKLKRIDDEIANINLEEGRSLTDRDAACLVVGDEVADTIIYGVLLAERVGIDIEEAVRLKFNKKSEEYGFPERIAASAKVVSPQPVTFSTMTYAGPYANASHDPSECGCENHAPWCPYNPHATEITPYPSCPQPGNLATMGLSAEVVSHPLQKLIDEQQDLPPEAAKVLYENLHGLYGVEVVSPPTRKERCTCPPPEYANHEHEPRCPLAEVVSQPPQEEIQARLDSLTAHVKEMERIVRGPGFGGGIDPLAQRKCKVMKEKE